MMSSFLTLTGANYTGFRFAQHCYPLKPCAQDGIGNCASLFGFGKVLNDLRIGPRGSILIKLMRLELQLRVLVGTPFSSRIHLNLLSTLRQYIFDCKE